MNIKKLTDWIEYHPEVREKYSSNSNTYAHYLIEYCVDQANALRDLWMANDIIDHLTSVSHWDRDFFEGQDSEVLCRLCDYEYLWSLVSEAMEEEAEEEYEDLVDEMVDEIEDYIKKDKIELEDIGDTYSFVQDYIDNKDIYLPWSHTRDEFIRDIAERL